MKKIVYTTLAAATLFASVGAASAQSMHQTWLAQNPALNTGGASFGYNQTMASPDNVR
ncbi:MAG: hypothetical protein KGZ73_02000 [Rhizobiales bacterium]|jgi:hypothetical protein|nr:hypothetical protein [Hyphomicrobiales bacterium]